MASGENICFNNCPFPLFFISTRNWMVWKKGVPQGYVRTRARTHARTHTHTRMHTFPNYIHFLSTSTILSPTEYFICLGDASWVKIGPVPRWIRPNRGGAIFPSIQRMGRNGLTTHLPNLTRLVDLGGTKFGDWKPRVPSSGCPCTDFSRRRQHRVAG